MIGKESLHYNEDMGMVNQRPRNNTKDQEKELVTVTLYSDYVRKLKSLANIAKDIKQEIATDSEADILKYCK